jgi:hypothetical protein
MVYRIRHHRAESAEERVSVVEAHTPTEAMVKFNTAHNGDGVQREVVTSVCAEESSLVLQW